MQKYLLPGWGSPPSPRQKAAANQSGAVPAAEVPALLCSLKALVVPSVILQLPESSDPN